MTQDLFDSRLTEQRNPRTVDIDLADAGEIVDLINAEDRLIPDAVYAERDHIARAIEIAVERFKRGGRLIYVGAGTSGRLGVLDSTECPPTFGTDPEMVQGVIAGGQIALVRSQEGAEDRVEDGAAAMDEKGIGADDFVFGIATSSTTPYVRGALARAVELGARTGFLCCTEPGQEMRDLVDVCVVPLVGPEVIAGSTRMKAGTATKLVLNTLTTGAMIRLGKVFGNLMVDLRTMSQKLVDRSQRIVMATTGCSREEASRLLEAAGGSAKLAIVMGRAGVGRPLAHLYLIESNEFVRGALELSDKIDRESGSDPFSHYPVAPPSEEALQVTLSAIASLPERVAEVVTNVPDDMLRARPNAERWSAKEQIEHLIECDRFMTGRLATMLSEDRPQIANRDDEVENRKVLHSGANETDLHTLLDRLRGSRGDLLAGFREMDLDRAARTGRHETLGPVSVYQTLRHLVWHDHRHLEAIRRLVSD